MNELRRGWCEPEVHAELPGLCAVSLPARSGLDGSLLGPAPPAVRQRLRGLSNRWRGARAVNVRQETVPAAYRVFFRQIGLDPDVVRTPIEAMALERMIDGGFLSKGALGDILTIALMDTGVPVWALDAGSLEGPLGIRLSRAGERLGEPDDGLELQAGQLVLADSAHALAVLFSPPSPAYQPRSDSREVALFSVQVPGVPLLHIEEALWACRTLLEAG